MAKPFGLVRGEGERGCAGHVAAHPDEPGDRLRGGQFMAIGAPGGSRIMAIPLNAIATEDDPCIPPLHSNVIAANAVLVAECKPVGKLVFGPLRDLFNKVEKLIGRVSRADQLLLGQNAVLGERPLAVDRGIDPAGMDGAESLSFQK